jgi:hypothetical protein
VRYDVDPAITTARPSSDLVASALLEALHNIFENLAYRSPDSLVHVDVEAIQLGGSHLIQVCFTHKTSNILAAQLGPFLYRTPLMLTPNDRLHLGGYTAGAVMRAVDGDVAFRQLSFNRRDGIRRVQTVITVPCTYEDATPTSP